ncbi:MAG: DUF4012 domain-containing protein [Candidatus Andersenbacteria bacterium]|nr:DUF4012 domain-containing protein [Candidatus Andersenbacteria bacterium]
MFDVLPPNMGSEGLSRTSGQPSGPRRARPIRNMASAGPAALTSQPSGPVQLVWKLPARLRKPIREQLAKERKQKKQREAIVHFERRPLNTQLAGKTFLPAAQNAGAEYHTGDVYVSSKPQTRVALPPYAGGFSRRLVSKSAPKLQNTGRHRVQPASSPPAGRAGAGRQPVAKVQSIKPQARPVQHPRVQIGSRERAGIARGFRTAPLYGFEPVARAVPIVEEAYGAPPEEFREPVIEQPKRLISLPFSFSFWPTSLFSSKKKVHRASLSAKPPATKLKNLGLLGVGCVVVMGLVWNLQGLGRGAAVLGSVEGQAKQAYEKLLLAQAAFAATDFAGGEAQLKDAGDLLSAARSDLTAALSSTQVVLKTLDLTGTVKSGDELLAAGELLTDAGQAISRGASAFFDVSFLADGTEDAARPHTLIDALEYAQEEFAPAVVSLKEAEKSLDNIGSVLLPKNVQEQVAVLQKTVPKVRAFLEGWQEHSAMMLDLLGKDRQRQYLLLFANNDELRPVGGFIGTVGLVNVDKGRVENIDITSVYDGDGQLKEFIAPPDPLLPIVDRWYLRDANWFVDYPTSARKIAGFFEKEGGSTVDGVILMTPEVIKRLIEITGPIEVPAYNLTLTSENFEELTQDQVTYSYNKELNKPKQFLADATPILLNRLFGQSQAYGSVLQALAVSLQQKDLLLYFRDAQAQARLVEAGWAGAVPKEQPGYLMVNNANIGGHKSDQFIEQEIDYRVEVGSTGQAEAVVTIRRTHLGPEEGGKLAYLKTENPATKDNIVYQRVLVPYGARLLETKGYTPADSIRKQLLQGSEARVTADPDLASWQTSQARDESGTIIGQEAGYTFFSNWIVTKPGQTTVTLYRYTLPQPFTLPHVLASAQRGALLIGKQPGGQRTTVRASLKFPESTRIVHTVPQSGVTQETDHEIVYRGSLSTDVVVGAVFTGR